MSYVAISSTFTQDVRNKLRQMRNKEVSQVGESNYKINGTRSDLLNWAWGEHLHLKDQMPAKWCNKTSGITLRISLPERAQVRLSTEVTPPLITPPGNLPSSNFDISADDAEIKPYVERECALYDIAQRWDKVDKQILEFFGKCKSVNEALKLWPQVEMYIPPHYIERVNEKKDRAKAGPSEAAKALAAMDTDHLTTAAVISRMTGQE